MNTKFFDSLFEGDSPNGARLAMGLTGGDFWPRPAGCLTLYRGPRWWEIDFARVIAVADVHANRIAVTAEGQAGLTYFLALRSVNGCGEEDLSLQSMVRITFDTVGDLLLPTGRSIIALRAQQVAPQRVRLLWLHSPCHAPVPCDQFDVYSDNASGAIDFEHPAASLACKGAGVYSYEHTVPQPGRCRFCVRCRSQAGSGAGMFTDIDVFAAAPQPIDTLHVEVM